MKKTLTRLGALILALALMLALGVTAIADTTLGSNGEQGAFTNPDTPVAQSKTLVLSKELVVYNEDETSIAAPTITYEYTIAPATVANGTSVTDAASMHTSNASVTVPVKAGVGTPTIANRGVVSWAAGTDTVTADDAGASNKKDISIDFSSVVFTGAGVYRYEITEALTSGQTYANTGVTETSDATNGHKRYIDVYVRPVTSGYSNGSTAAEWEIYGYTCFYNNESITDSDKTTAAVKTTGFVAGTSNGSTAVTADSYYTYNLIISKTVVNDGYGAATIDFPFTVLFTNSNVSTGTLVTNNATATTGTDFAHASAVDLTTGNLKGVATLKSGEQIKYVGIPCGTSVEVYETNVATGVTYQVTTVTDAVTPGTVDPSVSWGSAPTNAVTQLGSGTPFVKTNAYESTRSIITTTADQDDETVHSVAITNTLVNISPTGVVVRVAPFVLILAAGIALVLVVTRRRREVEE